MIALLSFVLAATLQAPRAQPKPATPAFDASAAVAKPLVVDGHAIATAEIQRELVYRAGRPLLDAHVLEFLADEELLWRASDALGSEARAKSVAEIHAEAEKRRAEARAQLEPSDKDVDARFEKILALHHKEFPTLPDEALFLARFGTRDWARDIVRRELYFEAVFLPADPTAWSATTIAALETSGGESAVEAARAEILRRSVDAATLGASSVPSDLPQRDQLRALVADAMQRLVPIQIAADGIPTELVARADVDGDGKPELELATSSLWPRVATAASELDVDHARRWLAATRAVRAQLARDGLAVESSGCADAFARYERELESSRTNASRVARERGFTSLAAHREAFCLQHAFRTLVEKQRAASKPADGSAFTLVEKLRPRAVESASNGMVNAEAILIPLFERPEFRWKHGGWTGAREEADALKFELDANRARYDVGTMHIGATNEGTPPDSLWSERLGQISGFWDDPAPASGAQAYVRPRNQGRFGRTYRADLERLLGESLETQILLGTSITDHVFFEQKEDTVEGPVRGPQGYYFTRLLARLPAKEPLDPRVAANVRRIDEEALRLAFLQYAREALVSAKVEGL